ncbi:ATP-binding protein [Butyrivibrio sp.]|uniref:ATP-binding protein n=1 Tax=Butyrivibrio sp. TaxID=28121 RepID=UPI0025BC4B05|nr:ATP-binding protein [Butyrivibrio sp.]MBQ9303792.1 response regulator [Butyrivibrio sp.]
MKRTLIIIVDLLIMVLILFFIVQYSKTKMRESNERVVEDFEKMTITAEQIIMNYLEDEQHLCDIWANYINRSAEAGSPMTGEEAISFIRKAKISSSIYGHLIFLDKTSQSGISTNTSSKDANDYSVSYRNLNIFDNIDEISREVGKVNLTRAYTNPQNGVQSMAFLNYVKVLDESDGQLSEAILMRVEPVSILEDKLVFLKGEYENVEISLINKEGEYLVHGKSLKNSNFFEYYKSYNEADIADYNEMRDEVTSETGTMTMNNSKGEECVISYTPLKSMNTWFLLAYIPTGELKAANTVVDWLLLGMVTLGLLSLLAFNYLILMLYNKKLAEAAEAANLANEAKSHFLSTMSHDIRTPMNAILGLNEMVLRDSHEEEIVAYSESIRTAGKTLMGIINDILDLSKIEAGKMDIIDVDYSFVSMLNDLVNMVQGKARDKGLSFDIEVDRDIPAILHGDEIRIKQVITNILSNAVKYTKEGSITFKAGFEKMEENPDSVKLIISVKDTGIGINPKDMDRLFVAFERIDENKNRNIEGTGVGMSIAQSFLRMMGSSIEVESQYGKGSTFSFELVQGVRDWSPIGNYKETFKRAVSERERYRESFTAPDARLLVVDDTEVNLLVLKNLLKRTKMQIDTATSGNEGIALYKRNKYDAIFLDHMMPEKDGIETITEMKGIQDSPNTLTPIICLTANAISGMREMYINAGFDDYITKPIDPKRLEVLLFEYLPKEKIAPASDDSSDGDCFIPDFVWKIRSIDVNAGILHCGSQKSYMDTLKTYFDSGQKNAEEIEKYWNGKDIKNTTVKIHALKSTSRVIGAMELGDFAARLEKAGEEGDVKTLETDIEKLLIMYRNLLTEMEMLGSIDGGVEGSDKPLILEQDIKKTYETISKLCEAFDFNGVTETVKSLEKYRFPESEAAKFETIKKAVDNFDYDLIPKIISG